MNIEESMRINEDKLETVGDLVDVDLADLKQKKKKRITSHLVFYFVQIFAFLFSSLLGYLFVLWEHGYRTGYPNFIIPRVVYLGPIFLFNVHGGNAAFSYFLKKKHKFSNIEVIPTLIVNIIVSFISFFMIYLVLYQPPVYYGFVPLYGVYQKNQRTTKKMKCLDE